MQQSSTTLNGEGFTSDIPNINPDGTGLGTPDEIGNFHEMILSLLSNQAQDGVEPQTKYFQDLAISGSLMSHDLLERATKRMVERIADQNKHRYEIFSAQIEKIINGKEAFQKVECEGSLH